MPSRRRITSPNRRPRVAGLTAGRSDEAVDGATTVTEARPARRLDDTPPRRVRPRPDVADAPADPAPADPTPADVAHEDVTTSDETAEVAPPVEPAADGGAPDETVDDKAATGTRPVATSVPRGRRRPRGAEPGRTAEPAGPARSGLLPRLRTVPVLAGVLVVLLALAVFFGVSTIALRGSADANTALTDIGTTTEVATQLGDALEIVYSYDFARLDENERAAREVITTAFSTEFDRLFTQVRDLAPQQQAVVSATVAVSAVQEISGDRAVLVAFMNQQATTVAAAEQVSTGGRLTVVGERVDGRWKIASVESR